MAARWIRLHFHSSCQKLLSCGTWSVVQKIPLLQNIVLHLSTAGRMAVHLRHRASTVYWTLLRYHARPYTSAAREHKDGKKRPTLDFSNTVEAFRSKSMTELLRHYFVFKSFTFNTLVDNSQKVLLASPELVKIISSYNLCVSSWSTCCSVCSVAASSTGP